MWFFNLFKRKKQPLKLKLGLALGSGGAKGFAHLGAIKAFEENGIEFDYVAGTSIGSIIGAFYADGYSSTDIFEMLTRVNFSKILSIIMVKMDTEGLCGVINENIGYKNIEELKKPFCVVATEKDTGKKHSFIKGNVAKALCASSSMPPFFRPVTIDGVKYIDGAFSDSVPSDEVKNLGADYIVGIDLKHHEGELVIDNQPWEAGYKFSDTMIRPNLSEFRPTSFMQSGAIYDAGYRCALEMIPKIKKDIEDLKK